MVSLKWKHEGLVQRSDVSHGKGLYVRAGPLEPATMQTQQCGSPREQSAKIGCPLTLTECFADGIDADEVLKQTKVFVSIHLWTGRVSVWLHPGRRSTAEVPVPVPHHRAASSQIFQGTLC